MRDCCEDAAVALSWASMVSLCDEMDGFHVWHARVVEFKGMPVEDLV